MMYKAFLTAEKGCTKWGDYKMKVSPYKKNEPIYYEFTTCPVAEFAKEFHLTEIMPALCNVDYKSMELLKAKLIRTSTCVESTKCDYTICGDQDKLIDNHPEYIDSQGFRRNK